jgi:hypothetical protein
MYIIIKCDGKNREVTVELWGTWDRDYYLTLDTEMISDPNEVIPPPEYVAGTGDPYELTELRRGRRYEQWQVYANKYNKETDELIEEKIPVTTSTYNKIVPKYQVGSAVGLPANGTPIEQVKALRDAAVAAAAAPVPEAAPLPDPNQVVDPNQATDQPRLSTPTAAGRYGYAARGRSQCGSKCGRCRPGGIGPRDRLIQALFIKIARCTPQNANVRSFALAGAVRFVTFS